MSATGARARRQKDGTGLLFGRGETTVSETGTAFHVHAGIDEAGLGPMLGPLTIGACALRLPEPATDPWRALADVVSAEARDDAEKLVVADSKVVFTRNARGERRLERTALAFLALRTGKIRLPADARELLASFPAETCPSAATEQEFWASELGRPLPRHVTPDELHATARGLRGAFRTSGIELLDACVRVVPTQRLNASFALTDNKGRTHWLETRVLLEHLWRRHAEEGLALVVDRQGGRMRYRAGLAEAFPAARVSTLRETAPLSEYELHEPASSRSPARRMHLVFREKAEQASFAVALASCLAKYARELCMQAFNDWFRARAPELRPTAGYVTDARRWLADASATLERLAIAREALVRSR